MKSVVLVDDDFPMRRGIVLILQGRAKEAQLIFQENYLEKVSSDRALIKKVQEIFQQMNKA